MRKLALCTATAALAGGLAAPALAGPTEFGTTYKTTSSKAGTKAKPRANTLAVRITAGPAGKYAAKRAVLSLDKNFKFNTAKFPKCAQSTVQSEPASCPSGSKVGTGKAVGVVAASRPITANLKVAAYNGGKNKLFLKVSGTNPVVINAVMVGTLSRATGKYANKLTVVIPESLQNIAGFRPTLTDFQTTINKTHKGLPYIQTTGCSAKKWNFASQVFYTDDTDKKANATAKCS